MTKLNIQAVTESGSIVYASISVPEDYTMNQVVKAVKNCGYVQFRLIGSMNRFAKA